MPPSPRPAGAVGPPRPGPRGAPSGTPHAHSAVRASAEECRHAWCPRECEHAEPIPHRVPAQDLERDPQRITHQVPRVGRDHTKGMCMVLHSVTTSTQYVIAGRVQRAELEFNNVVVPGRVHVYRRDLAAPGRERHGLDQLLVREVVHAHVALRLHTVSAVRLATKPDARMATKQYGLVGWKSASWIAPSDTVTWPYGSMFN
jgi:hypothetical protein